jgi:UDP-N-acetylglucosamine:LPS N-acetylglucosamine transferase
MSFQKQKRVLVFYADTGAGHRSVANAICAAMEEIAAESITARSAGIIPQFEAGARGAGESYRAASEWRAELHNPVDDGDSSMLKSVFGLYAPITGHAPGVFTAAYHITNLDPMCRLIRGALCGQMSGHLSNVVRSVQPDLVVSVNSLLTYPIVRAMRRCNSSAPLFMVVTDLASIHRSWGVPEVDRCFVPTSEARAEMVAHGMPAEKIWQSGLPVHPDYFAHPDEPSREALRRSLGLHPELFTVLLVGGGEGIGRMETIVRDLARSDLPIQLIVATGRNRAAYRRLEARREYWLVPQQIYGYAHNMPALMRASNVIVTKAGSVTIAEALSCGLPIVLSSVIAGQESGNVDFVVRNGVGCLARTGEEVVRAIQHLLTLAERDRREIRQRALRLSSPSAAFEVAGEIRKILDSIESGGPTVVPVS